MRLLITWIGLALILLVSASGGYGEEAVRPGEGEVPRHLAGEVVVRVEEALSEEEVRQVAAAVDAQVDRRLTPWGLYLFTFDERIPVSEVIRRLEGHPAVRYAEPNALYEAFAHPPAESRWTSAASWSSAGAGTVAAGQPVIVAVLDTGIDPAHPAFAGRLYQNAREIAGDGIDNDGNGYIDDVSGFDFHGYDADPSGDPGAGAHGTQVAGRVLAGTVDAAVSILPIRVGPGPWLSVSAIIEGIEYAVRQGARIINMSFGSWFPSWGLAEAVQRAASQGVLLVAAAGNDGWYGSNFPAAFPQVVSVAASTSSGRKAWFSNYGPSVDFTAPGVSVTTTTWGGGTTSVSGTSFSAPFLSGVAARLLAARPELTNSELLTLLRSFALDVNALNPFFQGLLGAGLINETVVQRIAQAFPVSGPPSLQEGEVAALHAQLAQWRQEAARWESELSQAQQAWEAARREAVEIQNQLAEIQQQIRSQVRLWVEAILNWFRLTRTGGWLSPGSIGSLREVQAHREVYLKLVAQEREVQQRLRVAQAEEARARARHQEAQSRRDLARRRVDELASRLASLQTRSGQTRNGTSGGRTASSVLEQLLIKRNSLWELLSLPHPIEELGGREYPEPHFQSEPADGELVNIN